MAIVRRKIYWRKISSVFCFDHFQEAWAHKSAMQTVSAEPKISIYTTGIQEIVIEPSSISVKQEAEI